MRRPERRQLAAVLGLLVALVATVATSSVSTIPPSTPSTTQSLTVDTEHPIAIQRFTVSLTAAAILDDRKVELTVSRLDQVESVRLVVTPVEVGPAPGVGPTPSPRTSPHVLGGQSRTLSLPFECSAPPCDRTFRVVAELTGKAGMPVKASWKVEGSVSYTGKTWPEGAAMNIRVDPAMTLTTANSVAAATPKERVDLDARRPAAARLVDMAFDPRAVPPASVEAISSAIVDAGNLGAWRPEVVVRQVTPAVAAQASVEPRPLFEPLEGCTPGVECHKTYLVAFRWLGGEATSFDWSMRAFEQWLGGDGPPADGLHLAVRKLDVSAAAPQRFHAEGDLVLASPYNLYSASPAFTVRANGGPSGVPLDLLPLPAAATLSVALKSGGSGAFVDVSIGPPGTLVGGLSTAGQIPFTVTGNPFPSAATGALEVGASNQSQAESPPPVTVHWSLDVDLYSYEGGPSFELVR